jgi:hypothetical protein
MHTENLWVILLENGHHIVSNGAVLILPVLNLSEHKNMTFLLTEGVRPPRASLCCL